MSFFIDSLAVHDNKYNKCIIIILLTHCSNDHTSTRQSTSQDDISSQRIHQHCKPTFSVGSPHQSALSTVPFISLRHLTPCFHNKIPVISVLHLMPIDNAGFVLVLKLEFSQYPATHTNYIISHCATLQYLYYYRRAVFKFFRNF